jgi:CRP-like cAMP-binding protein
MERKGIDMSIERLRAVPIFEKLSDADLASIEKVAVREKFPPEKAIFFEGDPSDSLYIITGGTVKVFQTSDDGKEKILNTMGAGAFFGEIAMLDGGPRSASVAAVSETEMLVIRHKDFRDCVVRAPELLWKVLEAVVGHTRRQSEQLLDLTFHDVPYRLLRRLSQLIAKHGVKEAKGTRLGIKLSTADLAGMIGSSPERVSRLLNKFQTDKLLFLDENDAIVVPDPVALDSAAEAVKDWV